MERVRAPDGRTLAVELAGDPDGSPVLVFMGTPNSRHLYGPNLTDAARRGLRLISYDRPGYGGSTAHPGRSVADCAADVQTICAALGIDRLAVWGISGGASHVLACAALLPGLVVAAASLASLAPYGAEGLDWFAGMRRDNVADFRLLRADDKASRAKVEKDRRQFLASRAADLTDMLTSLVTPADAAVLSGGLAEYLVASARHGLAHGGQGWWDDGHAQVVPWGFELADVRVPVLLLHGRKDRLVPFGHGQWLASHVPRVEARLLDDDGHLTLLEHRVGEVHSWLLDYL